MTFTAKEIEKMHLEWHRFDAREGECPGPKECSYAWLIDDARRSRKILQDVHKESTRWERLARQRQADYIRVSGHRDELIRVVVRFLLHRGTCWDMKPSDNEDRWNVCSEVFRLEGRIGLPDAPGLSDKLTEALTKAREATKNDPTVKHEDYVDPTTPEEREEMILNAAAAVVRGGRGVRAAGRILKQPENVAFKQGWNLGYEKGLKTGRSRERANFKRRKVVFETAQRATRLERAIKWALGEGDSDFGIHAPDPETKPYPKFWWRTELRRRAGFK